MKNSKYLNRREKIKFKIRKKITGSPDKPRLVVFRSNKHIYAQIVDDVNHKTLLTVTSTSKKIQTALTKTKGKIDISKFIGKKVAENALSNDIKNVVFDRNGYLYHGRIKAVADGAREGGLKF